MLLIPELSHHHQTQLTNQEIDSHGQIHKVMGHVQSSNLLVISHHARHLDKAYIVAST